MDDLRAGRVLITGASTGIGKAVARAFARQGASVALHYNRSEAEATAVADEIARAGGRVVLAQGDLSRRDAGKRVVEEAVEKLGGLDVPITTLAR
jgi:3-oxoacyl-[acyl-carrier protein] reductase